MNQAPPNQSPPQKAAADPAANQPQRLPQRVSNFEIPPTTVIGSETIKKLTRLGIEAETIGMPRLASGSAAITLERLVDLIEHMAKLTQASKNMEEAAAGANATASLIKSQAFLIKSAGGMSNGPERSHKGRKSFAKGQKIGPLLDVKP